MKGRRLGWGEGGLERYFFVDKTVGKGEEWCSSVDEVVVE